MFNHTIEASVIQRSSNEKYCTVYSYFNTNHDQKTEGELRKQQKDRMPAITSRIDTEKLPKVDPTNSLVFSCCSSTSRYIPSNHTALASIRSLVFAAISVTHIAAIRVGNNHKGDQLASNHAAIRRAFSSTNHLD